MEQLKEFQELGEQGVKEFRKNAKFGCKVRNHHASDNNPIRDLYFIAFIKINGSNAIELTNGKQKYKVYFNKESKLEIIAPSPFYKSTNTITTAPAIEKLKAYNILAILDECERQNSKWGKDRDLHPLEWLSILTEEVGEIAKEINDGGMNIQKINLLNFEKEVVQVGAVAMQILNNIKLYEQQKLKILHENNQAV